MSPASHSQSLRWPWVIATAIALKAGMILLSFAAMAVYSHVIRPGQELAFYQEAAKSVVPVVALVASVPLFFFLCRWIALRRPGTGLGTAAAIWGVYALLDVPFLVTGAASGSGLALCLVGHAVALGAALGGAFTAQRQQDLPGLASA